MMMMNMTLLFIFIFWIGSRETKKKNKRGERRKVKREKRGEKKWIEMMNWKWWRRRRERGLSLQQMTISGMRELTLPRIKLLVKFIKYYYIS